MNTIRLRRKIESETLHLPELKPFIDKTVEFIVIVDEEKPAAESESALCQSLQGSIVRDDNPFEPVAVSDWETMK